LSPYSRRNRTAFNQPDLRSPQTPQLRKPPLSLRWPGGVRSNPRSRSIISARAVSPPGVPCPPHSDISCVPRGPRRRRAAAGWRCLSSGIGRRVRVAPTMNSLTSPRAGRPLNALVTVCGLRGSGGHSAALYNWFSPLSRAAQKAVPTGRPPAPAGQHGPGPGTRSLWPRPPRSAATNPVDHAALAVRERHAPSSRGASSFRTVPVARRPRSPLHSVALRASSSLQGGLAGSSRDHATAPPAPGAPPDHLGGGRRR